MCSLTYRTREFGVNWFIEHGINRWYHVPPISPEGLGGICLLGWFQSSESGELCFSYGFGNFLVRCLSLRSFVCPETTLHWMGYVPVLELR